jgi:peptidoglycan/LPS O-acetylase OafA/YrhL
VLQTVQASRAMAALAVTAFHLSLMMGDPRYGGVAVLEDWTALGKAGVDFFFVLSGFIILHAHAQDIGRPQALGHYLWRRFVRVYPVYWLYLGGYLGMVAVGLGREATFPASTAEWLSAFSLWRFSSADMPLFVAWTLCHEVAFYLAFAVLIMHKAAGVIVLASWAVVCLAQFQYPGERAPDALTTYTSMANLYFLIGMGAWWLLHKGWAQGSMAVLGALLVLGVPLADGMNSPSGPLVMALGFGAWLAGLCALERRWRRPRLPRSWLALGDASYSLYLLHLPVCGLLLKALAAAVPAPALGPGARFALVLAGACVMAWAAYRWVEAPLLRRLRSRRVTREPLGATLPT